MNAWTPGPWKVARTIIGKKPYVFQPDKEHEPDHWRCMIEGPKYSIGIAAGETEAEALSNARLIALSPEWPDVMQECVQAIKIMATIYGGLSPAASKAAVDGRGLLAKLEG